MNHNSRRKFINNSLRAVFLAAVFAPIEPLLGLTKQNATLPTWKELVDYARWCPSVHNLQPHKTKIISETEAELYYDPAGLLQIGDPSAIFATAAIGILSKTILLQQPLTEQKLKSKKSMSLVVIVPLH